MEGAGAVGPDGWCHQDDDTREAVVLALNSDGYEAVGAATDDDALTLLRSGQVTPRLQTCSMMPGMNGWQFRGGSFSPAPRSRHA